MTVIRRAYNPQTRDFKPLSGNTGGVVNDSNSTTIIVDFPTGYLDDKDAFIAFNVTNPETNQPYWYSFGTGSIEIPYEVASKVEHNKLEYQLLLIGKTNPNYVEQSAVDTAMFMRSIMDYPQTDTSIVPAVVELTMLRYALEQRVKALEDAIAGGVVPVVPDDPDPQYFLMSYKSFYGDMEGIPINSGEIYPFAEEGDTITLSDIRNFVLTVTEENQEIIGNFANNFRYWLGTSGSMIEIWSGLPAMRRIRYQDENDEDQYEYDWVLPTGTYSYERLSKFTQYDMVMTSETDNHGAPLGTVTMTYEDDNGELVNSEERLNVMSNYGGVLTYTDDVGIIWPALFAEDPRMDEFETSFKFKVYIGQEIDYVRVNMENGEETRIQGTFTQSMLTDDTFRYKMDDGDGWWAYMGLLFIDDGNGYYTVYPYVTYSEDPDLEITVDNAVYHPNPLYGIIYSLQNKKVDFPPPVYEYDPEYSGGGGSEEER